MWGRDKTRNMVSPEKNAPVDFSIERKDFKGKLLSSAKNIKWSAPLGSVSLGGPVVSNGLVWVGTNNYQPRDPNFKKDASVLSCFRESDGKFLWQYVSPRLPSGQVNDYPHTSMPAPLIEDDRLWLVTNRCETVCFDIGPLRRREGEPKLVWKVDMIRELGVHPRAMAMALTTLCCIGASYKDTIYVVTGNGVDESRINIPAPKAPSLIALHKQSGQLLWQDNTPTIKAAALDKIKEDKPFAKSPIQQMMDRGEVVMEGQWTSPLVVEIKGQGQVIVGQGDGWLRSFDAKTGRLIWKCDLNRKGAVYELGGNGERNYVLATPVLAEGRIYIGTGQHPADGSGLGRLFCIDPTNEGDISLELEEEKGKPKPNPNSGVLWHFGKTLSKEEAKKLDRDYDFGRSVSNCVVHGGLVYAAEVDGFFYCLDARTGQRYWMHDVKAGVYGSPLWVDGKVYLVTEDGDIWIYTHGKELKEPRRIETNNPIRATPIFANGVLYVMTERMLYAIQEKK